MLYVERSNRTERLLGGLAARLMAPGRDPLAPSVVVVQGPGMERWVAQSIAQEFGICANTEFPFPQQFLEHVFDALPETAVANPGWEVSRLTWWIARLLDERRDDPDFGSLAKHLDAADGDWRLVQLARLLANLMDRYITFRPDWVFEWDAETSLPAAGDERWQIRLFRLLRAELGFGHVADRARRFLECVESPERGALEARLRTRFPDAVEIFAISTLPPLYLSVIEGLARLRDVHLSVLSPSRFYWADLWREVRDGQAASAPGEGAGDGGLFAVGPSSPVATLLAGLGRLGSDFQLALEGLSDLREGEPDLFEVPVDVSPEKGAEASLLARLQAQLLDLDEAEAAEGSSLVRRDDDSIRVHLCHGPRREIEVVEGLLREAFERDPTLAPEDVIVMAPDIDAIAPDIDAVFGASEEQGGASPLRIPYRIADRGAFRRSPVAEAFRGLLDLLGGRCARSEVIDWLALEPVRERFGIDETGVEQLSDWAERAGITFGLDATHREALGLAPERTHTLRGGLDRLALAHAVGPSDDVFEEILAEPLDVLASPALLGALGDLEMLLCDARRAVGRPRSVEAWSRWLLSLLEASLAQSDTNAHEHATIREVLFELATSAAEARFSKVIPFDAVRERLADALESTPTPQAFLAGGVTFCELVPLRAIPFRVIAILGMSDMAFPRGRPPAGFDLMAKRPRAGDRSTRADDRYLFLEAILSAREKVILTAPARDVRDGSDLPPSVVISELLDAVDGAFDLAAPQRENETLRDWLVVAHPLQAFSPRYFEEGSDPRLVSRSREAFEGVAARRGALDAGGGAMRRFLAKGGMGLGAHVAEGGDEASMRQLDLASLVERLLQSTRHFAREQLRLRLPRPEGRKGDLDPIELDGLEKFALGSALLDDLCSGVEPEAARERLLAHASIPPGIRGRLMARSLQSEAVGLAQLVGHYRAGEALEDVSVDLTLPDVDGQGVCRLVGRLDALWPLGRVQYAFAKLGGRRDFALWIRHLVLCALVERGAPIAARSIGVGRAASSKKPGDRVVAYGPVPDPLSHLARLFDWAWSVREAPLPFFEKSSYAFAQKWFAGKEDAAWHDAQVAFYGSGESRFRSVEAERELETLRVWEGWSPLRRDDEAPLRYRFDELAKEFFEPLLAAREVDPR